MKKRKSLVVFQWDLNGLHAIEAVIVSGAILSKRMLSEPWAKDHASIYTVDIPTLAHAFKALTLRHQLQGHDVIVSLPRHCYFEHTLLGNERTSPLTDLAEHWFPFPLDQMIWLTKGTPPQSLCAITRSSQREFVQAFHSMGFNVVGITTTSVETSELIAAFSKGNGPWFFRLDNNWVQSIVIVATRHINVVAGASVVLASVGLWLGSLTNNNRVLIENRERRSRSSITTGAHTPSQNTGYFSVKKFVALLERLPARCYLSDLSVDNQQCQLTLHGRAGDYTVVTKFTTALLAGTEFKKIADQKLALIEVDGRSVVDFSFVVPL